jgi:5-methylcytosine-specific restriction endonuclease McrA
MSDLRVDGLLPWYCHTIKATRGLMRCERPMVSHIKISTAVSKWASMASEQEMRQAFVSILTRGKKNNTYKFALARYLLDYSSGPTGSLEIPYSDIAGAFLRYYWHQECKFRIRQNYQKEKPPSIIRIIREEFGTQYEPKSFKDMPRDKVRRVEERIQRKVFGSEEQKTSQVIPRFQNIPAGSTVRSNKVFYEYDDAKQMIILKPDALEFFKKNNTVLLKAVILEWAKFLEKINTLPKLVAKIEGDQMRRRPLRKFLMVFKDLRHCFYCNCRLQRGDVHVDHFIPWSYIFDDEAWNLVLSCSACNLKKRDSLAQEEFLLELIRRNSDYYERIAALKKSLNDLDSGKGWKSELRRNYSNCLEYGFTVAKLP